MSFDQYFINCKPKGSFTVASSSCVQCAGKQSMAAAPLFTSLMGRTERLQTTWLAPPRSQTLPVAPATHRSLSHHESAHRMWRSRLHTHAATAGTISNYLRCHASFAHGGPQHAASVVTGCSCTQSPVAAVWLTHSRESKPASTLCMRPQENLPTDCACC